MAREKKQDMSAPQSIMVQVQVISDGGLGRSSFLTLVGQTRRVEVGTFPVE